MPNRLEIPEQHRQSLAKLFASDDSRIDMLANAFSSAPPTLDAEELATTVSKAGQLANHEARSITDLILSLYRVRTEADVSIGQFADDLLAALSKVNLAPDSASERDRFKQNAHKLLSIEYPLGVIAKAQAVMTDHAKIFQEASFTTDFRPVLGSNPHALAAGVIIHTLKLRFFENNDTKNLFIALDSADLRKLKKAIEKTIADENHIKSALGQTGLTCLSVETRE